MMTTNISSAFAVPDYQVVIRQEFSEDFREKPSLQIEVLKTTEQLISGVVETVYETIVSQSFLMMAALAKTTMDFTSRFIEIPGLGKAQLDENDSIVIDSGTIPDTCKSIEFITDRNVIIKSLLNCEKLDITAPNVVICGNTETFVESLNISISSRHGIFAIKEGTTLKSESVVVDGQFINYGILNFLNGISIPFSSNLKTDILCNYGMISGRNFGIQSSILFNYGTIGEEEESNIDLRIYKSFCNYGFVHGRSANFSFTSEYKGLFNSGEIILNNLNIFTLGKLINRGRIKVGELNGFVSRFFNEGEFFARTGLLTINSGENQQSLSIWNLEIIGTFLNKFFNEDSRMFFKSVFGNGKFINHGIFSVIDDGTLGVKVFHNKNLDYIRKYGNVSFGKNIQFTDAVLSFLNDGIFIADSISYGAGDIEITNSFGAVIQANQRISGRVRKFNNFGTVLSEESTVVLDFDTFINRGETRASKGVFFYGNRLENYSNILLVNPKINHIINGRLAKSFDGDESSASAMQIISQNIANLLVYAGSGIERLENNGHAIFLGDLHKVRRYVGTIESEAQVLNLTDDGIPKQEIDEEQLTISKKKHTSDIKSGSETIILERGIQRTAEEIAALPIDQRRKVLTEILAKVKDIDVLKDEIEQLQTYLRATDIPAPYSPTTFPLPRVRFREELMLLSSEEFFDRKGPWMWGLCPFGGFDHEAKMRLFNACIRTFIEGTEIRCLLERDLKNFSFGIAPEAADKTRSYGRIYSNALTVLKKSIERHEKSQIDTDYEYRLRTTPFPLSDLRYIISTYSKHVLDESVIDQEVTQKSLVLGTKFVTEPCHDVSNSDVSKQFVSQLAIKHIEGVGRLKAHNSRISNIELIKCFLFLSEELEILGEVLNTNDISFNAKLIFNTQGQDFQNTGNIACREFWVRNCRLFKNQGRIETLNNTDIHAKLIFNSGKRKYAKHPTDPITVPHKESSWLSECQSRYGRSEGAEVEFNFYSVDENVFIKSYGGKVVLNGTETIVNEYSSIIARNGFSLFSESGQIYNLLGNIYSIGKGASYVHALSFEHWCNNVTKPLYIGQKHYVPVVHFFPIYGIYNTSDKAHIYTGGDLHIDLTSDLVVMGADISSGGSIYANVPSEKVQVEQVLNLIPEIKAHDKIFLNGRDMDIKGAMILAGSVVSLSATGAISIINPDGQQYVIPPNTDLNLDLSMLAATKYKQLIDNTNLMVSPMGRLDISSMSGMRYLFLGQAPDPSKSLLINTRVMSALPLILSDYTTLIGPRVLNSGNFLAFLDRNARELSSAIIPANIKPKKPLLYFKVKDRDAKTQEAVPYIYIPKETFDFIRERFGIVSPNGLVQIEGDQINLVNACLKGALVELTAKQSSDTGNDEPNSGTITALATIIKAIESIVIKADNGTSVNTRINKEKHIFGDASNKATIEFVKSVDRSVLDAQTAILISGGASSICGTLIKTKTFIDETLRLHIGVNKERLYYKSRAQKDGFFCSSSIRHYGYYDIAVPSVLSVEEMLSANGESLIFESVIAENLKKLYVQKSNFKENTAILHAHDEVQTSSSGFSFGKVHISDPLVGAWQSLLHSSNSKALIGNAISAASTMIGTKEDAEHLFEAVVSGINADTASFIAGTMAKRLVNVGFSFGTTRTTTVLNQTCQLPNQIVAELIKLECPKSIILKGFHIARNFIAETESFTTSDIVNTANIESHTSGNSFSLNPISAVVSFAAPSTMGLTSAQTTMGSMLGMASSAGVSTVSQHVQQTVHVPTTVIADKFILRAGRAHLTDTQIRARLVDAIIRGDLVLESIANEFFNKTNGGSFSVGFGFLGLVYGIQNITGALKTFSQGLNGSVIDIKEIDRRVNNFASLVGEEQFNLVVGGTLLARSAFYGQKSTDEEITSLRTDVPTTVSSTSEHIEAGRIRHEVVSEEHFRSDDSFTVPVGDLITVASTLSPNEELAKTIFDVEKEQGTSDAEALQITQETAVIAEVTKRTEQKIVNRKKVAVAKIRQAVLEQSPELAAQTFHMDDDSFVNFVEQYAYDHKNISLSTYLTAISIEVEQARREILLEAARQFEALPLSEKAKHYAEAAREATLEYANDFATDPFEHTKTLASELGYFALDMAVPGGIEPVTQYFNGKISGSSAFNTWAINFGAETAAGGVLRKFYKGGKTATKVLTQCTEKLHKVVVEKLANPFVRREKRWMQLAESGKLSKEVVETIKKNNGKYVYKFHGLELAHLPGKPAYRGFDYSEALPKTKAIHRNQHRFYDDLPGGGIKLVKRGENSFSLPKKGIFARLDEIEMKVKR